MYFQYELSGISSEDRVDSSILFQVINSFEKGVFGTEGVFEMVLKQDVFYSPSRPSEEDLFLLPEAKGYLKQDVFLLPI